MKPYHQGDVVGRAERLTRREQQVLSCIRGEGLTNRAIARRLAISPNTVRNHVNSILSKLHVHSKLEAAVLPPAPTQEAP